MRALLATAVLAVLSACGGLDNAPLRVGLVRGLVVDPTPESLVFVENAPALVTRPGAAGTFELSVPQGDVTLVVLASASRAERRALVVQGGGVTEAGSLGTLAGARLEAEVHVPSLQSRAAATLEVGGVLMTQRPNVDGEIAVGLPSGCFPVRVVLRGLGVVEKEVCLQAPEVREVHFDLPAPDGSPGREGCSVTGCEAGYACRSNGTCE